MALPRQQDIYLPLLLELDRRGGSVRPDQSLYDAAAKHFADLSAADKQLTMDNGQNVWTNAVGWARYQLTKIGEMGGHTRGVWEISQTGSQSLRALLQRMGLPPDETESFLKSGATLQQRFGEGWSPEPRGRRSPRVAAADGRPENGHQLEPSPTAPAVAETSNALSYGPVPAVPQGQDTDPIRARLLGSVSALAPGDFERLVGVPLKSLGMEQVQVTGRSHDGGIDGMAQMPLLGVRIAFQAKRWQQAVGSDPVRSLIGSVHLNRYDRGVLITTSTFTPGAREEADKPESKVSLIDGQRLADLLIEKCLGITEVPLVRQELDEHFFEDLKRHSA